jgi:hypothetical protein
LVNTAFPRHEKTAREHTGGNDDDSGVDGVDNITLTEYTPPDGVDNEAGNVDTTGGGMDNHPDEEGNNAPSKPKDVSPKRNDSLRKSKVGAGK